MQTLEDFIGALRPFLRDDAEIFIRSMFNHTFVVIEDTEASLCFSASCDEEENSWIEFKNYPLTKA